MIADTNEIEMGLFRQGLFPTSPRQMEIVKIKPQLACNLNAAWHSRLPIIDWSNVVRNVNYICYGALFDWRYFAVAIWSSPVARNLDPIKILELRRLAISEQAPKYTATWMLGKMARLLKMEFPEIERLVSYQDTEVHTGTIYKAANWIQEKETNADDWTRPNRSRNQVQARSPKIRWGYKIR